jgi:hypothetical protein
MAVVMVFENLSLCHGQAITALPRAQSIAQGSAPRNIIRLGLWEGC